MTPLLPRLVRNDPISRELRSSKSSGRLLPHAHAHSAADVPPGFRRCASAEDSTGWVEHEEFLGQRHYSRRKRGSKLALPKLMSSFEDFGGEEEDSGPAAHMVGEFQDENAQGTPTQILGTTTAAQDDVRSSARRMDRSRFFEPLNALAWQTLQQSGVATGHPLQHSGVELLNDTTGRAFRKTPPPPIIRGGSPAGLSTSGLLPKQEEEEVVEKDACRAAHRGVKLDECTIPSDAASM